jgi:hypothetical protein
MFNFLLAPHIASFELLQQFLRFEMPRSVQRSKVDSCGLRPKSALTRAGGTRSSHTTRPEMSPGDQFKVFHHLANRYTKLVRVDDARKLVVLAQPFSCFKQEILVLRNEDAPEFRRPLQQQFVIQLP